VVAQRVGQALDFASCAICRAFRYRRGLRTAWSLMTWEQRMAFRHREPELARDLEPWGQRGDPA
jgi:hypothetical protein